MGMLKKLGIAVDSDDAKVKAILERREDYVGLYQIEISTVFPVDAFTDDKMFEAMRETFNLAFDELRVKHNQKTKELANAD